MQHSRNIRQLGRNKAQRLALLRSLSRSLIEHEAITTTVAKAKELRPFVERLVTASKAGSVASRRIVASRLGNDEQSVKKLHDVLAVRYSARAGGYTRITLLGQIGKRAAESARIEFVK
jgi:large subunit ribosomal protein L17